MEAAVVSSVLNTLAPKIFAFLQEYSDLLGGLEADIQNIRDQLVMIDAAIEDHHRRSWRWSDGTNDAEKFWIQSVRDLAYSMQDCMDSFLPRMKGGGLKTMSVRKKFAKKIRKLRKQSEEVSRLREKYTGGGQASTSGASPPTSEVPELHTSAADLVGIDVPRDELLELMREDEGKPKQLKVISIVGLGGLGKTVLARQVYDSVTVGGEYELRVWVRASEKGAGDVLSEILRQVQVGMRVHGGYCDNLSECLRSKRFLIVIDDMRTEYWNAIKNAFPKNMAVSSRVIVTTTIQSIANACSADNGHVYVMRTLDEEHSKRLFFKEASLSLEYYVPAEQVLKKCDGLPLALVTTARLLQSKRELTPDGCADLCRHLGEHVEKEETLARMKHALLQSYYSLPSHVLKVFLLYLGIFPSGRPIRRKRLIRRWLAEGFVEADHVAMDNFKELMNRSIIQHVDMSNNTEAKTCKTHGMVLEFILQRSMCENFITLLYDQALLPDKIRWLSLHHNGAADRLKTDNIDLSLVRSLTIFGKADEHVLEFSKYKLLRVLDLEECETLNDKHVKNICNLLRLRYLSLGANITMLPKEISKLKFLETLDVRSARVKNLPIPIEVIKLPCLIHLLGAFSFPDVGKEKKKLQTFLSKNSVLETLAGFVADQSPAFPQLMSHMNSLKKVKVWCEPTADGSTSFTHLSRPLQEFIQRSTKVMDGNSLSLSFKGCSQDFLDLRHEDNWCNLSLSLRSLKLHGELQRLPLFVTKLGSVTELCLSSPVRLSGDVLAALSNVRGLHYLKLITRELHSFVIKQGELNNLRRLCIEVQSMACLENQEGALPQLESLWLLCKGLNGLCGAEIEHLTRLKEVALDDGVSEETKEEWKEAAKKHLKQPRVSLVERKDVDQNRTQMGVGSEPRDQVSESRAAPSPEVADIPRQVHRGSEDPAVHKKSAGMFARLFCSWKANGRTSTVVSCSGSGQDGVTKPPENGPSWIPDPDSKVDTKGRCKTQLISNDMDDAEGARAPKKRRVCGVPHSRGQCDQHPVDTLLSGEQVSRVPVGKPKKRKNPSDETPAAGTHAQILRNQRLILNTLKKMKTIQIEFQNETHKRLVDMQMAQNDFQERYTCHPPPPSGASNRSALAVPPLALAPVHQDPASILSQDPAPVPPTTTKQAIAHAGFACQALHTWYMQKTGKKRCDTGITVAYKDEHFFNGTGNFVVGFNDLFNLFDLEALDASLLRCWTLYMMKNTRQGREPVGFLDPHVVSLQTIKADPTFVENYITAALLRQTHNDYIMVPYNQGFHWILLVIIPRRNKVIYLDSLIRNNHDFSILQGILDNSFISYVGQEGAYNGSSAQLRHMTKFPCRQQKNDELCAFYVCHHMQQIISAKTKNPEDLMIDLDGLVAQEIVDVRGKLCAFIMSEIVNKGEFHSVADPEFHAKN